MLYIFDKHDKETRYIIPNCLYLYPSQSQSDFNNSSITINHHFDLCLYQLYKLLLVFTLTLFDSPPKNIMQLLSFNYSINQRMSLVDPSEIESLLEQSKATSISEIVTFITVQVSKQSLSHLADIDERLSELEKPKGMDRIMIEQVKALVQAMLDQREQSLRRELQRNYKETVYNSFEFNQQQSRRSLHEIDVANMLNMKQPFHSQQIKRSNSRPQISPTQAQSVPVKNDLKLEELREEIMSRPERRELQELRQLMNNVSREVVGKVNFEEAQKLMLKFQREIFVKMKQDKVTLQEIQAKIRQTVEQRQRELQADIEELTKSKVSSAKMQKKIRKYLQQMAYVRSDLEKLSQVTGQLKLQCDSKHKAQLDNIESLEGLVENLIKQRDQSQRQHTHQALLMAVPISTKNSCVTWQKEVINNDLGNIEFQTGKTMVRVVHSGFYEVQCLIYGCKNTQKAPMLMYNSDIVGKFESKNYQSEMAARWGFRELIHVKQNRGAISVRYDGEESSAYVLLRIQRITF